MFEEYFEEYEEENEYDDKYLFVGWIANPNEKGIRDSYKNHWKEDDWVYIIQEGIDDENIIFYKDYPYHVSTMGGLNNNIKDHYEILSKEDMEKYIYNNKKIIHIYSYTDGQNDVYYKDLPDEVKNNH